MKKANGHSTKYQPKRTSVVNVVTQWTKCTQIKQMGCNAKCPFLHGLEILVLRNALGDILNERALPCLLLFGLQS